ncbi:MAG: pilus assembly protein PilP [Deltaproteobacteria bacterium]|nr:pilus assembly protein PilP [Deltaproteobacteria bacterium]
MTQTGAFAQAPQAPPLAPQAPLAAQPEVPAERQFPEAVVQGMGGYVDPGNLQKHPLDDFSLSAIVVKSDPNNNIALLEMGGIGYNVQKGSRVGSNNGVVREITENKVVIEELGADGKASGKMVTLSLQ